MKKNFIKLFITFVFIFVIGCTSLYVVRRTECKMESSPTLALLIVYESKIFEADTPSTYPNNDPVMKEIQEELTRLGFNFYVIDPLLNDYVNTAIASTIKHERRVNLIASHLKESYDYLLYVSIRNSYDYSSRNKYRVECASRFKLINDEILKSKIGSNPDAEKTYDIKYAKAKTLDESNLSRTSLKDKSIFMFKDPILNFCNDYVRSVKNYEYVLEGSSPICFDFIKSKIDKALS